MATFLDPVMMDVTDWTGEIGSSGTATKEGVEGVRPDSTMEGNPLREPVFTTETVQNDPPLKAAQTVEEAETLSLDDMPLSKLIRTINVTAEIHTTEREAQ